MINLSAYLSRLFWLLVILSLLGCAKEDTTELTKYIAEIKARPKSPIEPLPEIKVVEPFVFNAKGIRDPFAPIVENTQDESGGKNIGSGIKPDPLHQKEELEQYPLDALKMVGTVYKEDSLWALITVNELNADAKNKEKGISPIHRVRVGNFLGTNYGKITRINNDKIELTEIVPDKPGSWREQEQTLPLVLAE